MNNNCAVALGWKPEGNKNRGRPKTTWRRTVEKETWNKQPPTVEGRCPGLVRLLARDLTTNTKTAQTHNGPSFTSQEFKELASEMGFTHKTFRIHVTCLRSRLVVIHDSLFKLYSFSILMSSTAEGCFQVPNCKKI